MDMAEETIYQQIKSVGQISFKKLVQRNYATYSQTRLEEILDKLQGQGLISRTNGASGPLFELKRYASHYAPAEPRRRIEKLALPDFTTMPVHVDLSYSGVESAMEQLVEKGLEPAYLMVSSDLGDVGFGFSIVDGMRYRGKLMWLVVRPEYPENWWCVAATGLGKEKALGSLGA